MKDPAPQPIFLKNYRQPDFEIASTELHFNLFEDRTVVRSKLAMRQTGSAPLVLNGEDLKLKSIAVNGQRLNETQYTVLPSALTNADRPKEFVLEIEVEIDPGKNLSCEGLYKSSGMFCTQCEAESFRRITYFLDRPDVMSVY